jgi:hypothetical protein
MRALCEGCGQPQPPDWKAGDLCSFCGKAVRHDVRCYWCAKWVPAGKFCRSCGAAVVEERLYGAARMLKDAGTDRFTIPKQLQDFDPDQIENFSRIYQRHSVAVARHVDEVRFLERFLRQKHWSAALEEQLVPQLPWNEETLGRLSSPMLPPGDDLATVKAIEETSPFSSTKMLASLARVRLGDWSAHKNASSLLHASDPTLCAEAALVVTGWRVLTAVGHPRNDDRTLTEVLQRSAFKIEAAVRLGFLGQRNEDLLREALTSSDPETAFAAALLLGDVDRLQAALQGDDLERIAAGNKLIELGIIKPVIEPVRKSPIEVQQELVSALLDRKEPVPEMGETLLEIVETTQDKTLRERAARILCRGLRPEWTLRIARAAKDDSSIYQSILQIGELPPDALQEFGDFLIERGRFGMHQYGLPKVAEEGRMPATFVPTRFGKANENMGLELLRFAEVQLGHREDEQLHRFVMNVVFGPHSAKTRAAAWWVLHRWYRHQGEYRGEGPFRLKVDAIRRFFGSVGAFLPKLSAVLRDHATLKEVGVYEFMATLLNSADEEAVSAIQAEESAADELVHALIEGMRGDYWPNTVEGMIKLLSQVGGHPRWREQALEGLRALNKPGNYYYDKALRRLQLSAYGIPEESDWDKLPLDFVPARFDGVDPAGQGELLKVAEHQLIHKKGDEPDAALLRFLLRAALKAGDHEVREEALHVYSERAPGSSREFLLKREEVERTFGSFSEFIQLLPAALREAAEPLAVDVRPSDLLDRLFSRPDASDAALLAGEGEAGHAVVQALLIVAGARSDNTPQKNFRRTVFQYLAQVGAQGNWRDEVIEALDRLRAAPEFDLVSECERALRQIRPPEAPKSRPHRPHPRDVEPVVSSEPTPVPPENPYVAKQKIAERMGKELQQAIFGIMAGPASPEEKMREATRLSEEFQAKIKDLYKT